MTLSMTAITFYWQIVLNRRKFMNITITKMSGNDFIKADNILDFTDADPELITDIRKKENNLYSIVKDDQLLGVAQIEAGKKAFLYIFIDAKFRHMGIGSKAFHLCEDRLKTGKTESISTSFYTNNIVAKSLASKLGYRRTFSSTFMKYAGQQFDMPELSIRPYCDKDYKVAHEMYAVAFHDMRVSVGDFPDSVVEQPSEEMRELWDKTHHERLVYTQGDEIVGYARVLGNEIVSVAIKSQHQGKGLGRNFVKFICNKILSDGNSSVGLFCVVGNGAKNLYDSLGFEEVFTGEIAEKRIRNTDT